MSTSFSKISIVSLDISVALPAIAWLNLAGGLGSRQSMIKWGLFFWGFGMALVVGGLFTYHVVCKGASHLGPADLRVI